VTAYDNETPGVIVQETGGSTVVVEGSLDTYRVRLTAAPLADVTLTLRTDKQTFLDGSAAGWQIVDETGANAWFEYTFTFTSANWHDWVQIEVSANPAFAGTDSVLKSFATQDQNLDRIRGPLVIEGGIGSGGPDRSLQAPVLLPSETNSVSGAEGSNPASEPGSVDTLNVFHTDSTDADIGRLFYRTLDGLGRTIRNPGLALTGFEMGGDFAANQGTTQAPDYLYYGGGITYNGFEIVEVLLGKGNETLTIDDTGDRDEKAHVTPDPATITAVHGGGGSDTIIANDRGNGPLVIYGDTSQDGVRYSNDQPEASNNGTSFNNPGNDTINASAMPQHNDGFAGVVIYGGTGNDTIYGGDDDDHLAGGAGDDTIYGGAGNDHIYGDSSFDVNLASLAFTLTTTGSTGMDTIHAGEGDDIVIGDHGVIEQEPGTVRLHTTAFVTLVETVDRLNGKNDAIYGDAGDDVLIGGPGSDRIDGGSDRDLILGDNVRLDRTIGDGMANARHRTLSGGQIYSTTPATAGSVLVTSASQTIPDGGPVWEDFNIELLDHDSATQTLALNDFGNDYIAGGPGDDAIFGELGNDVIQGDGSIDLPHDVGASRNGLGELMVFASVENSTDGADYIEGNGGNDVIFGNLGQDDIIGGSSNLFSLADRTQRPDGADLIFGGAGIDVARSDLGDGIHGRDADMILGDNGNIYRIVGTTGFNYDNGYGEQIVVRAAALLDYTPGGSDYNAAAAAQDIGAADELHGESGDDVIYGMVGNDVLFGEGQDDQIVGGYGNDWISAGTGDDAVLGDDGRIFVSRNSTTLAEPLYGISTIPAAEINLLISNSNGTTVAITNVAGALKYTVDLTPYSVVPGNPAPTTLMPRALNANDIIYGGLGNDSLHGGAGEDAISGAEAPLVSYVTNYTQAGILIGAPIRSDYAHPVNPGNVLGYDPTTTKFALYDANDPLRKVTLTAAGVLSKTSTGGLEWALNFNETEGPTDTYWIVGTTYAGVPTDGDDVIFGDLGHDWMVGGTGRDTIWAGWGDDLVQHRRQADDSQQRARHEPVVGRLHLWRRGIRRPHRQHRRRSHDRLERRIQHLRHALQPVRPACRVPRAGTGPGSVHVCAVQEPGRGPDAGRAVWRQRGAQRRAVRRAGYDAPGRRGHERPEWFAARSAGPVFQVQAGRQSVGGRAAAV
jgi:Ca2+-binding RTX toxin-like protein